MEKLNDLSRFKKDGSRSVSELSEMIKDVMPEIIEAVLSKAKDGDLRAAKLLMDKVIPTLKPVNLPRIDGLDGDNVIHIRWAGGE